MRRFGAGVNKKFNNNNNNTVEGEVVQDWSLPEELTTEIYLVDGVPYLPPMFNYPNPIPVSLYHYYRQYPLSSPHPDASFLFSWFYSEFSFLSSNPDKFSPTLLHYPRVSMVSMYKSIVTDKNDSVNAYRKKYKRDPLSYSDFIKKEQDKKELKRKREEEEDENEVNKKKIKEPPTAEGGEESSGGEEEESQEY